MIYTSYFGTLNKIPKDIIPIAICGKSPNWYTGLEYKKLAPKYGFFMDWKETHDDSKYTKCFYEQVLDKLDVRETTKELYALSNGNDIVLLCYEKPSDFCHRHLVAHWLEKENNLIEEI